MACLGLARTALERPRRPRRRAELAAVLRRVQNELFNLGSDLATLPEDRHPKQPVIEERHVQALEQEIDAWNERPARAAQLRPARRGLGGRLPAPGPHRLPAGRAAGGRAWPRGEPVGPQVIPYLNRLSDALFVMSRHAARVYGQPEPLWEPEKT